jgi:hypothetical protein
MNNIPHVFFVFVFWFIISNCIGIISSLIPSLNLTTGKLNWAMFEHLELLLTGKIWCVGRQVWAPGPFQQKISQVGMVELDEKGFIQLRAAFCCTEPPAKLVLGTWGKTPLAPGVQHSS